ncbi:MAG: YfcE family phosphodiesterase [Clostridia bacterium]|nr:YfcE family phosphodiesterase [Clostridia bacterium]
MKFAVLGDIHSNIYALESVLKDIKNRDVDFVISTGDLVGYLPFPNEVIDLIRSSHILSVQGNHDRFIGDSEYLSNETVDKLSESEIKANASAAFTNSTIADKNREYLRNMPSEIRIMIDGLRVLVVHGSPRRIDEYIYEDSQNIKDIANEVDADIIISGHTHIPFYRIVEGKHFINAGSAGKPKHGNANATYVIVDVTKGKITSEILEVPYDLDKIAEAIEQSNMFDKKLSDMLRKGY